MEKMTKKVAFTTAIDALSSLGGYEDVISILQKEITIIQNKTDKAREARAKKRKTNDVHDIVLHIINSAEGNHMTAQEVFDEFSDMNTGIPDMTVRKIQYQLTQLAKENLINKENSKIVNGDGKNVKAMTYFAISNE